MAVIGELIAQIKADTSGLRRGLHDAERSISSFTKTTRKHMQDVSHVIFSLKGALAGLGLGITAKQFIEAASTSEQYRVRLNVLLGDIKESSRLFNDMTKYAAQVPFTYQEIMGAATQLSTVLKGGVDQIKQWMPMVGDLAAASGLTIEQTTQQIIRMYSAGAGAADLFRERGVLAMMGFQAGATYSAEETTRKMIEEWTKMDSKFRGAADELGDTWKGLTSMISDRWFQMRNRVMDAGVFDMLKGGINELIDGIDRLEREGQLDVWAKTMAGRVIKSVEAITYVFEGWLMVIHEIKAAWAWIKAESLEKMIPGLEKERERLIKAAGPDKGFLSSALGLVLPSEAETEMFLAQAKRILAIDDLILKYKEYRVEARESVVEQLEAIGNINKRFEEVRQWLEDLRTGWFKIKEDLRKHELEYLKSMGVGYIFPPKPVEIISTGFEDTQEMIAEIENSWIDMTDSMHDSFVSAIERSIFDGGNLFEDFFEDMGRMAVREFAKSFSQQFMQPIFSQMAGGISGMFGPGNLLPPSFMDPPGPGQTIASSWGGYMMGNMGMTLGVGAMGYGMGGIPGTAGALGGMALGGPIGALVGGALGGYIQDIFDSAPRRIPEIDTIWNVVGDQVELVSASWKNISSTEGAKLIQSYQNLLEDQTEFFARLSNVIGAPMARTLQFGGKGQGIIAGALGATQTLQYILANYQDISPLFGPSFGKEIQEAWDITRGLAPFGTYKKGQIIPSFKDIISTEDPYATFEESIYGTYKEWFPKKTGGALNEFTQNIIQQFISAGGEAWTGFYEQMQEKLIPFQEGLISTISGAFMQVPRSEGFQAFEDAFNQSLAQSIKSSFSQMLGAQAVGPLTQALMPAFALSEQYIQSAMTGGSPSIAPVALAFQESIRDLTPVIESMKPLWETLGNVLNAMNAALGLNTEAIIQNTDAILGPVQSYLNVLASMDSGPTSMAYLANRQQELFTQAFADPAKFSAYSQFMTSGWLKQLQGTVPDWEAWTKGEWGNVISIPWVQAMNPDWGQQAMNTASTYSASKYSYGFPHGGSGMVQQQPVTIQVIVDGRVIKEIMYDSLDDASIAQKLNEVVS